MEDLDPIRNLRFAGFDIAQLQEWIGKIKSGRGAASMDQAATALQDCANIVTELDDTLRRELGKLQIEWQGNAGSIAQEATAQQTAVMRQSQDPLATSASGVEAQGRGYETAKNGLPDQSEMRHQQSENFLEWSGGAFGYTSDYDEEAKQIDGNKQAAQQALSSYRDTTVQQAGGFQPLPEMHPAGVSSQSCAPAGGSGVGGFAAPGSGGSAGDSGSGAHGGGAGGHAGGSGRPEPGGFSGSSPEDQAATGGDPDRNPLDDPPQQGIGLGGVLGIGAGGAAVAGIGAVAASKLLGGRTAPPGSGARGGSAGGNAGGGGQSGALKGGSAGIGGGPGDTTAGKTAGGSATSRPGQGSMMGPAATRGQQDGADGDEEHQDKYFQAETPFDDNRLVAPPVFGETGEPGDEKKQG